MSGHDGAFPSVIQFDSSGGCANSRAEVFGGLSLRDYFAAQVLPAVVAGYAIANSNTDRPQVGTDHLPGNCAAHAYRIADAMLAEREKASR